MKLLSKEMKAVHVVIGIVGAVGLGYLGYQAYMKWVPSGGFFGGENQPPPIPYDFDTPLPEGMVIVSAKDAIPAIFDPEFVTPKEANIPLATKVIGVSIGGEAHAYAINLLDRHEIVNDVLGGKRIATTW